MTERDLQDLEHATRILVTLIERHRVQEEDAAERRAALRIINFAEIRQKNTLKEINERLIQLNLSLKVRERKDGRFEIRPTIDGRKVSIYGKSAEELAKKYELALKKRAKGTTPEPKSKIKLFSWLDQWLEIYKKPNVAKNTYENLQRCIKKQIKGTLPDKALNSYTVQELTQALNSIESTRMRKYARGTLRDIFRCAVVAGHIKTSPAENLLPVKHVSQKGKAFALLDLKNLIETAANTIPRCAWLYFVATLFSGARRAESLEITTKDCDYKNHILLLHGTKTDGSMRRLPMFPILEKIFQACDGISPNNVFSCSLWQANHYFPIFCGTESQATLHWLRHTFGTVHICVNGIPVNTVAHWMGHSNAKTTMDTYTHPEDLAPDIYFSGNYSEEEKLKILKQRWNDVIETVERLL